MKKFDLGKAYVKSIADFFKILSVWGLPDDFDQSYDWEVKLLQADYCDLDFPTDSSVYIENTIGQKVMKRKGIDIISTWHTLPLSSDQGLMQDLQVKGGYEAEDKAYIRRYPLWEEEES